MSKVNPAPADALTPLMIVDRVAAAEKELLAALAHLSYAEQLLVLDATRKCIEVHDTLRNRSVFQSVIPMGALPPDLQQMLGGLIGDKPRTERTPPTGLSQRDLDEIMEQE